jgi:hypothetical protein
MLSDITEVRQLYFGLMFIATVMYALAARRAHHDAPIWRAAPSPAAARLCVDAGADRTRCWRRVLVVEMVTHLSVKARKAPS